MGVTLATLRKYIRAEVGDPAPTRVTTTSLAHDGASNNTGYFEDNAVNFVTEGVVVGDVIYNITDGGSLATIRAIADGGGGTPTNSRLYVSSIEGGTDNEYDTSDVVYIYDRHAQRGLDGTKWTDTEVEDALRQSQKLVAIRFGGVEKYSVQEDIKVMTKINLTIPSGTFTVGEIVTGADNGHTAVIEYVGDDFIIVSTMITEITVDGYTGVFEPNETITGANNGYTARLITTNGSVTLTIADPSGEFEDDEEIEGATSGATCDLDEATTYSSGLFVAGEEVEGGTSAATANVRATYAANNICLGQDMPTNLKHLMVARWWDGSHWYPLVRDSIREFTSRAGVSGDPFRMSVFGVDQLVSDAAPNKKIWLWPSNSTKQYNELHLFYMAWDRALSADTDTTDFDNKVERLVVLEAAKILAGQVNEDELWKRILGDIQMTNDDITGADGNETDRVAEVMHWNHGFSDDDGVFIP
jgi:hypothetical protein